MPRERLVSPELISKDEESFNRTLRPPTLEEYIGQKQVVEKLSIALAAAKKRGEALDHPADLMGILANLGERDLLFIDEIHRLPVNVEEFLYPAMEDFKVDIVLDKGMYARTINYTLKKFTLVGATTRAGSLSGPLRNRFGLFYHLDFYRAEELKEIVLRSAGILGAKIGPEGAMEIALRARGTPRIANRLLRRVRDYAEVKAGGQISAETTRAALSLEGVD